MKRYLQILFFCLTLSACSDPYDLRTRTTDKTWFVVEAAFTNIPSVQTVTLSESIPYQSTSAAPAVSDATVTLSDGTDTYEFTPRESVPGCYDSPAGFYCKPGKTYTLRVKRTLKDGSIKEYYAESQMEEPGFDIEKIDYKYLGPQTDSTWVVGVWGKDKAQTHYFLISTALNGVMPPGSAFMDRTMLMPDTYFNGSSVSGFPIAFLYQTAEQMKLYGDCAKPLKSGDVVSLVVYTIQKDYYDFLVAMMSGASATSVPIISSQPANLPTNIQGENVAGYFSTSPVTISSCIVDDPKRQEFKK